MNNEEIKLVVKEKYGSIAKEEKSSGCCGTSCCSSENELYNIMVDEYKDVKGYVPEADLGLGCGLPTEFAGIKKGDVVLDLGSGAGNDVFVASAETGETGFVIGVDMTPEMIEKAERNKKNIGFTNVDFRFGEIENLPVEDESIDVVISNCVLNLVPDKAKAFSEIFRVLKPEGHFCVSDIVIHGNIPDELRKSAEFYAGCVSGALKEDEYLNEIKNAGFKNTEIKKSKKIDLPDELLLTHLSEKTVKQFNDENVGIYQYYSNRLQKIIFSLSVYI
jgi:arsenite methyltransferase